MEQGCSAATAHHTARRYRWAALLLALGAGAAVAAVHTWVDPQGQRHFGDRPPPGADTRVVEPVSSWQPAPVAKVVDGDTLRLRTGETLRLIGIDTPELPFRGRPGEPGATAARDHLASLLDDTTQMTPGETPVDRYQRRLVYLKTEAVDDVSEALLRDGHARVSLHEDNAQHADRYFAAEALARQAGRGLWAGADWQPRPASDAGGWRNRFGAFRGRITAVELRQHAGRITLNGSLELWIDRAALGRFDTAALKARIGDAVVVRGIIRQHHGRPYLPLQHPGQWDPLPLP